MGGRPSILPGKRDRWDCLYVDYLQCQRKLLVIQLTAKPLSPFFSIITVYIDRQTEGRAELGSCSFIYTFIQTDINVVFSHHHHATLHSLKLVVKF